MFLSNLMHESDGVIRKEAEEQARLQDERRAAMESQIKASEDKVEEFKKVLEEINPVKL